jgi:NAD(P)H-hydrate epimerase
LPTPARGSPSIPKKIAVLCGPGHNGADGAVAARRLGEMGFAVDVISFHQLSSFLTNDSEYDAYVDALFGTGLSRPLASAVASAIEKVNAARGLKFSFDIPSGLDADTGLSYGAIFKADHTLSIERPKPGFYLNQGPGSCGKIHRVKGVFPLKLVQQAEKSVFLISKSLIRRWLPTRSATDNKTRGGKTLILAGSRQMPGAALLSATAAARSGAGYVFVSDKDVLREHPEFLIWDQKDFSKFSSVLIGPGLGTGAKTKALLSQLRKTKSPVVIDADALTVLSQERHPRVPPSWILTPHAGELSRLIGLTAKDIENDRLAAARMAQEKIGGVIVLKGFHTVVACASAAFIVPTGNAALAKAGSGDVLAGMIAGFLSQKISVEKATLLGCYVHGLIADRWLRSGRDVLSLQPSDLLEKLPRVLSSLRNSFRISFKISE